MNKKNIIPVLILLAVALVTGSCDRTKDKYLGPKRVEARSDFQFSTPKHYMYNVDTKISTEFFPAVTGRITMTAVPTRYYLQSTFSQEVTWNLEIYQPLTGAKKIIEGTSAQLDETNALWDGTTSNNILFVAIGASDPTDSVFITLSFLGTDQTFTQRAKFRGGVGGATAPGGYEAYFQAKGGMFLLIDDFDNHSIYDGTNEYTDSRLRQEFFDAVDGTVVLENSYEHAANLNRSFHYKGTDKNKNAYVGGINTFSLESISKTNAAESRIPNVDPSDLYFNFFVYGVSNQTTLQVKVYELENTQNYQSVTPSFVYDSEAQKNNDAWTYDVITNWTGWKLVSVKYSAFKRANDPNLGGNGNGIKEPNRISGLAITLTSQDAFPSGEAYIDFVNFTTYYPFVP